MIKKVILDKSERLQRVPPFSFFEIERTKQRLKKKGVEIIDLGVFNPQLKITSEIKFPPSFFWENAFSEILTEEEEKLKQKISFWFEKKYQVKLNPEKELTLLPTKRVAYLCLALSFLNKGDVVIIPDPSDPLYRCVCALAESEIQTVPLFERNDFLPNLKTLSEKVLKKAKLLFLNYPNNPTSAVADYHFFKDVVEICSKNNILLVHDFSFSHIIYDDYTPLSPLQIDGAKKVCVEYHSLSTNYTNPLFELGFFAGGKDVILELESEKKIFGSLNNKIFLKVAFYLLENYYRIVSEKNQEFSKRKSLLMEKLLNLGWRIKKPKATPFFWIQIPPHYSSLGFARMLLRKSGLIVIPGSDFGENGEGYIRLALNLSSDKLNQAIKRIEKHSHLLQLSYRPKRRI